MGMAMTMQKPANEKGVFLPQMWQDDMQSLLDAINKDARKWFAKHNRRNDLGTPKFPYHEGETRPLYASATFSGEDKPWLPYSWVEAHVRDSLEGMRCDLGDEDKCIVRVHVDWKTEELEWLVTVMRVNKEQYATAMEKAV